MQDRIRSDAYRTIAVCVDSYTQGVMKGRFYNYEQEDEVESFSSLAQLIIGIEQKLNTANYPQSFTAMRTFSPMPETRLGEWEKEKDLSGVLGNFVVKIIFRQHTSWQGTVTWLEGRGEQPFRSVLELILLMNSALGGIREEQAD